MQRTASQSPSQEETFHTPQIVMNSALMRRLTPLYLTAFFQGFVIWYATEKLFMKTIGFSDAGIGLVTALVAFVSIVFETPSGILADRWSRKGVLILGSICLAICSFLGGTSDGVVQYAIAVSFWSIFFAFYSGTYDSIVYDTLLEEEKQANQFTKYYGRIRIFDSVALVSGSLANIFVVHIWGLQAAYFWTIPFSLLAIVTAISFREPKLHKKMANTQLFRHISETLGVIVKRGTIFWIVLAAISLGLGIRVLFEFNQLWFIALGLPLALYGLITALLQSTIGIGGLFASYLDRDYRLVKIAFAVLTLASVGLIVDNRVIVVTSLVVALALFITLQITVLHRLHDQLSSNIRAGASSAVNTLAQLITIPASILVGVISAKFSAFAIGWVVIFVSLISWFSFSMLKKSIGHDSV